MHLRKGRNSRRKSATLADMVFFTERISLNGMSYHLKLVDTLNLANIKLTSVTKKSSILYVKRGLLLFSILLKKFKVFVNP